MDAQITPQRCGPNLGADLGDIRKSVRKKMRAMKCVLIEAVTAYPGGLEAVARELGVTSKRLAANLESLGSADSGKGKPKMGVQELTDICKLTGDLRVVAIMAGPGFKVVPLPPPSENTDDPQRALSAALRHFNLTATLWASCFPSQLGVLGSAMGAFADLTVCAAALSEKATVSKNELKELHLLDYKVVAALQALPSVGLFERPLIQCVADLRKAVNLLEARLPEWARNSQ